MMSESKKSASVGTRRIVARDADAHVIEAGWHSLHVDPAPNRVGVPGPGTPPFTTYRVVGDRRLELETGVVGHRVLRVQVDRVAAHQADVVVRHQGEHGAVVVLAHEMPLPLLVAPLPGDGVVRDPRVGGLGTVAVEHDARELRAEDLIVVDGVVDGAAPAAQELRPAAAERSPRVERVVLNRHDERAGVAGRRRAGHRDDRVGVERESGVLHDQLEVRRQVRLRFDPRLTESRLVVLDGRAGGWSACPCSVVGGVLADLDPVLGDVDPA